MIQDILGITKILTAAPSVKEDIKSTELTYYKSIEKFFILIKLRKY